jgi:hypothetical protein
VQAGVGAERDKPDPSGTQRGGSSLSALKGVRANHFWLTPLVSGPATGYKHFSRTYANAHSLMPIRAIFMKGVNGCDYELSHENSNARSERRRKRAQCLEKTQKKKESQTGSAPLMPVPQPVKNLFRRVANEPILRRGSDKVVTWRCPIHLIAKGKGPTLNCWSLSVFPVPQPVNKDFSL